MSLGLRAELARFQRQYAAPAVDWAATRSESSSTASSDAPSPQPSWVAEWPLALDSTPGASIREQGVRWAVAVREKAARAVEQRIHANNEAKLATAQAEAAKLAAKHAAAAAARALTAPDTTRQQVEWAAQAQQAMRYEEVRERKKATKAWAGATSKVELGRSAMLGGLFATSTAADERTT